MSSARYVHEAARLVLADMAAGKPVPELRLMDAGGPVADAALEAFRRLERDGVPFAIGFGRIAEERGDMLLLLLAAAMERALSSNTPDALAHSKHGLESVLLVARRNEPALE